MDGVDRLNNILVIGMTNRLDMIDEALLRPGRLEVHMEISLPDARGRYQILRIHTAKMRENKVMDKDVDLEELAQHTKNYSGAEIEGFVKSATSFALNRHVKVGTLAGISDDVENLRVNRNDFMGALDEIKPAFGVSEEEITEVLKNGIITFDEEIKACLGSLSFSKRVYVPRRKYFRREYCLRTKWPSPSGHRGSVCCCTVYRVRERRRWPLQLLRNPSSLLSRLYRRTVWLGSRKLKKCLPLPRHSKIVTRVPLASSWSIT